MNQEISSCLLAMKLKMFWCFKVDAHYGHLDVESLNLLQITSEDGRIFLVGHDVGSQPAYSHAAEHDLQLC